MIGDITSANFISQISALTGLSEGVSEAILLLSLVWIAVWKGLALWKACKKDSKIWFIALLFINTLGILEILYFFLFSKIDLGKNKVKSKRKR